MHEQDAVDDGFDGFPLFLRELGYGLELQLQIPLLRPAPYGARSEPRSVRLLRAGERQSAELLADWTAKIDTDRDQAIKDARAWAIEFAYPLPAWLAVHREIRSSKRIRLVYDYLAEALMQGMR